jgi:diguanylate cyclase (GGDEF)-like protein/PAS domain S-box-containing protein
MEIRSIYRKSILIWLGTVMLAALGLQALHLWRGYQAASHAAEISTRNYAAVIEARLDATLRRADAVLQELVQAVPLAALDQAAVSRYGKQLNAQLDARTVNFEELNGLRIFDAQGDLLYTSNHASVARFSIADRGHFQQLRDNPQLTRAFSDVMVSRASQRPIMVMAYALRDAQGVFRGVAVTGMELLYFQQLFRSLEIGPGGIVAIRRVGDGRGVVLWPDRPAGINEPLAPTAATLQAMARGQTQGTVHTRSVFDGVPRIVSFQTLPQYPFYVSVAMARADVLADWRKTVWVVGLSGLLLTGLTIVLLSQLWRAGERELKARAALAASERRTQLLAQVFEHSGESILITDRENRIQEVNPAFTRLTGYSLQDVKGQNPRVLASGRTTREEYQAMWQSIHQTGTWRGEVWDRAKNGTVYPKWITISVIRDAHGEVEHHIANFIEIAERKQSEEKTAFLANHDALTGLPNRYNLQARLEQILATARREGSRVALLFLDLDRFKSVNDSLGHHAGDELLKEVASRLVNCVRDSDVVARLGGDEFVVVLADVAPAAVEQIANNILQSLARTYRIEGRDVEASSSIGIAVFPADGDSVSKLMRHADSAMYQAKSAGRNTVRFFHKTPGVATVPGRLEQGGGLSDT